MASEQYQFTCCVCLFQWEEDVQFTMRGQIAAVAGKPIDDVRCPDCHSWVYRYRRLDGFLMPEHLQHSYKSPRNTAPKPDLKNSITRRDILPKPYEDLQ